MGILLFLMFVLLLATGVIALLVSKFGKLDLILYVYSWISV